MLMVCVWFVFSSFSKVDGAGLSISLTFFVTQHTILPFDFFEHNFFCSLCRYSLNVRMIVDLSLST
jgi:hypothetical protein